MERFTVNPEDQVYKTYADAAREWSVDPEGPRTARFSPEQVTPQMIAAQLTNGAVNPDGSISYDFKEDDPSGMKEWLGAMTFAVTPFLGPITGLSGMQLSAAKAALSMATGGNPVSAIISAAAPSVFGGADASTMAENSFDSGAMDTVLNRGEGFIGTGDPMKFASAGVSDTGYGANKVPDDGTIDLGDNDATGSGASTQDTITAEQTFAQNNAPVTEMGKQYTAPPEGFIGSAIEWAKLNPQLAGGLAAGGLGLIGGVGQALLGKSAVESKIAADKELLAEKAESEKGLLDYKRSLIQKGSYFDSKGLPTAAPKAPLRRPDGSLVFNGGLIAGTPR